MRGIVLNGGKMRKLKIFITGVGLLLIICSQGFCEMKVAPYYYLYTSESVFFADTYTTLSTNIYGDFAVKMVFNDRWSLLGLYELNYQGPGATSESKEGANFQEQYQDHSVILKPSYLLSEKWTLGGRVGYALQLSKTGSTESWNKGLYNYYGWMLGFEGKTKIKNIELKPGYLFTQNLYPNYSNLIGYYDKKEARPEQDHYRHKFYADASFPISKTLSVNAGLNDTIKAYAAQGIIGESGVEDTSVKQVDNVAGVELNLSYLPLKGLSIALNQKLEANFSNQNDFTLSPTNPSDTTTTQFNQNYYSYTFYEISPGITYTFSNNLSLSFSCTWNIKNYHARPARDSKGFWLSEIEYDVIRQLDAGVSLPMGKFSLGINYTYVNAVSNMGYAQYYRYNYTSHNAKLSYSFEY